MLGDLSYKLEQPIWPVLQHFFALKKSSLDLPSFFFQNPLISRDGNYGLFDFIVLCLFDYLGGEDKKTIQDVGPSISIGFALRCQA